MCCEIIVKLLTHLSVKAYVSNIYVTFFFLLFKCIKVHDFGRSVGFLSLIHKKFEMMRQVRIWGRRTKLVLVRKRLIVICLHMASMEVKMRCIIF